MVKKVKKAKVSKGQKAKESLWNFVALSLWHQVDSKANLSDLTVLSFGGGQDSTAILLLLLFYPGFRERYAPGKLLVVMSDVGDEHPYTHEHVERMRDLCKAHNVEFVLLTNDMGFHTPAWQSLMAPQERDDGGKFKPSLVQLKQKACTIKLKIDVIYKFLDWWINKEYGYDFKVNEATGGCNKKAFNRFSNENGKIRVLIGFGYGEEERAVNGLRLQKLDVLKKTDGGKVSNHYRKNVYREFPLIDMKWKRSRCQEYIRECGFEVPMPSNCMRCPYMSDHEFLWLHRCYPEKMVEWAEWERKKLERGVRDKVEKNHGVFNSSETIMEKLERVKGKFGHLSTMDLAKQKMNHGCSLNAM